MTDRGDHEEARTLPAKVIILDWKDLLEGTGTTPVDVSATLAEALGPHGLGLIALRNVPDFLETKRQVLRAVHTLAHLPPEVLEDQLTHEPSMYNAGWSHGKEKLGDTPDWAKGSFYYNPISDVAGTEQDRLDFPCVYPPNLWPSEHLMPKAFREQAMALGRIMTDAVQRLAGHIDALAQAQLQSRGIYYPPNFLSQTIRDTDKVKCRLLYYFPLDHNATSPPDGPDHAPPDRFDSWIGWHNDSGFFTALCGDLYIDHQTGAPIERSNPADQQAGLYVWARNNHHHQQPQQVQWPEDCLAIQIGECTQIVTGGTVAATPHAVRAPATAGLARISGACFVDTSPRFRLEAPASCPLERVLSSSSSSSSSARVPLLADRWVSGMTFGDFLQQTFAKYYQWQVDQDSSSVEKES